MHGCTTGDKRDDCEVFITGSAEVCVTNGALGDTQVLVETAEFIAEMVGIVCDTIAFVMPAVDVTKLLLCILWKIMSAILLIVSESIWGVETSRDVSGTGGMTCTCCTLRRLLGIDSSNVGSVRSLGAAARLFLLGIVLTTKQTVTDKY